MHTSDYLRYLRRKQTVTSLPPHLKNIIALPCKMHKFFIFFTFSRVSSSNLRYGRLEEALRLVLNFSTAWWTMQLISGKKDWKHVSMQKVVTLNSHQCQPTTGSFQIQQRLEKRTYLQSDENVVHFTR